MLQPAGQGGNKRPAALLLAIIIGSIFVNVVPSETDQPSAEPVRCQRWIDSLRLERLQAGADRRGEAVLSLQLAGSALSASGAARPRFLLY
jgi:hypothetical protein